MKLSSLLPPRTLVLAALALASFLFTARAEPASDPAADAAWKAFQALPTRWPSGLSPSEIDVWTEQNTYGAYAGAALKFYQDFPRDPRRWDAAYAYAATIINFSSKARPEEMARAERLVAEILAAPDAPLPVQERAAFKHIAYQLSPETNPSILNADVSEVLRKVESFFTRFPKARNLSFVEQYAIDYLLQRAPEIAEKRLRANLASSNAEIAAMSKGRLAVLEAARTPLQLKFTAIDGRELDLASLRGKVVLIDFWATWCVPCVAELPNVQKVYGAYHAKGFEVVGISLDSEKTKETLLRFIQERNMPWPQYFDGLGWENKIAKQFAVRSIPSTFLLDQRGVIVSTETSGPKLEILVKKLLN